MPGKIKVKVLAGRNLPVMDRSGDTTDAYVELKFGNTTYKTDVCRKSLNPQWNSEWYRFEVDDAELQDEPLQIRLMDHDTYSANDAIGKVYINLNPLLLPGLPPPVKNIWTLEATMNSSTGSQGGSVMTGWIPVYDTMHGIRGEVNIIVKVELFSDFNKFRESSCGVQFFYSPNIPHGYHAQVIHGFVEELVVSDDPEYKWIDKIRTPRASNEARQTLFFKLSGEVQRKIGLKALDLGGNAVIGYLQNFDLEGESGIVARGIGTAVTLVKLHDNINLPSDVPTTEEFALGLYSPSKQQFECLETDDSVPLLPHSPNYLAPSHATNVYGTRVSNKFPGYGKPISKRSATILRVSQYEPIKPQEGRAVRQMSIENNTLNTTWKRSGFSTLSLTDDAFIDEASLRSMLALEDMRGEPTSRFSRGLKNLRQLPQSLALKTSSIKSKISDSCDEESDLDSTYSSTWSVGGSDSARSSIVSLGQMKRKRFTHKKTTGEGMASLLIRSIHNSIPLDSVQEDRETPTPSPVKFLADISDANECKVNKQDVDDCSSSNGKCINNEKLVEYHNEESCITALKEELVENKDEMIIPMISSSETDTSTSDDEQSESSANYNILDDTESLIDPGSPVTEAFIPSSVELQSAPASPSPVARTVRRRSPKVRDNNSSHYKKRVLKLDKESSTSTDPTSSDMDADILNQEKSPPVHLKLHRKLIVREKSTSDVSSAKTDERDKSSDYSDGKKDDTPMLKTSEKEILQLSSISITESKAGSDPKESVEFEEMAPLAMSTPVESNINCDFVFDQAPHEKSSPKETYLPISDEKLPFLDKTVFSDIEFSKHITTNTEECTGKIRGEHKEKDKETKKVHRTDTVIYKGPLKEKEKPFLRQDDSKDIIASTQSLPSLSPIPIIINPPDETSSNTLQVPPFIKAEDREAKRMDIVKQDAPLTPKPLTRLRSVDNMPRESDINYIFRHHSMLELIKIIDTKLLVHHGRTESIRSRKKRHDRQNKHLTPSPEVSHKSHSHRGISGSRTPERHLHGHHKVPSHTELTSSFPENLPICQSSPTCKSNSRSCNSSLESLHKHDSDSAALYMATSSHSTHSKESVPVTVSASHQQSDNHHTAAKKLAAGLQHTDKPFDSADIELSTLKSKNTNLTLLLSPETPTDPIYKSCSASNLRKMSDDDESTKITNASNITDNSCVPHPCPNLRQQDETSVSPSYALAAVPSSVGVKASQSPATKIHSHIPLHRRSSDSDLSITPKGNSLAGSDRSVGGFFKTSTAVVRTMNQDALEMLEYPFITMQQYPPGFVVHIGGLVSSRSVKLLERISNPEEPEGRDAWWTEIRMEVRSHARALACNVVVGYKEETSICDDVCVLNASGTAAVINLHHSAQDQDSVFISRLQSAVTNVTLEPDREKSQKSIAIKPEKNETDSTPASSQQTHPVGKVKRTSESNDHEMPYSQPQSGCHLCHLPYSESSVPFRVNISKCTICKRAKVPDVMFTTIEIPENMPVTGRGGFIQATVCKSKKDLRGELHAKEISDCLPFLEYELHSLLLNKLQVKGMNAIFGLRVQVSVGERLIIGMAVGTAVFLTALPPPSAPQIASGNSWHNEEQLVDIQKALVEAVKKNREFYKLKPVAEVENGRITTSDTDESDEDLPDLDLSLGTRDTCVLEVDDVEDLDRISLLMDDKAPDDFHVVNTQSIPGLEDLEIVRNLQMFTQVSRAKIPVGQSGSMPSKYLARLLQTVYFKLRRMVPCALCDMQFKVALPEQDEIQIFVVGMALGLGDPVKLNKVKKKAVTHSTSKDPVKKPDDNDMIFSLDEDHVENSVPEKVTNTATSDRGVLCTLQKSKPRSPLWPRRHNVHKHKHMPLKERYGVDITPLSYLPGGRIERYLGNLNFFFIRESTSIRENGGLSGFTHSFVMEVLAIVRAHITALGGNAMVAFFMTQCVLLHSPHKNQGQCLINVGGDVVSVSYFANEKHSGQSNC